MASYVQQNRSLRVSTPVGEDVLLLDAFSGTDEISRPFRFQIEMIAENGKKVPFDAILGEKVTAHLAIGEESTEHHFNGVCVRFVQAGRDKHFTRYRADLVPEFQLLARKAQSRIFQRKNVPDILKEVLKGVTVQWQIEGTFEKRDFCVQYRESDFNFASRLMEEEGIFYFFRHEDGCHTMVVANASSSFPALPEGEDVLYDEVEGGVRDEDRILTWERSQEARSVKYLLWDHSFEIPHKHLEAEEPILASVPAGRETHSLKIKGSDEWEVYDWPGEYAQRFDGINRSGGEQQDELQKIFQDNTRTVGIRMDEEAALAVTAQGTSTVKYLAAGHKMTLKRHFSGDGSYILASVTHRARCGADYRSGKSALTYKNGFTCFPSALPFRPKRLTVKPLVQGSQTAVVVGPKGEEIFTDKYGRVKVQFHWDRKGKNDEDSSCWVRVGQLAAGRRWGASYWPRIGQEVLVDFLEGDPDQPIVVGTVYNADQMPPYLGQGPDGKHKNDNKVSGFKSNTTKGGSGFNELRFDDTKDKQQVFVHAERNMDVRVKKDAMESVLNDKHVTVGKDGDGEKKGSYFEKVFKDKHVAVLGTLQEKVGDAKFTVGGEEGNGNLDVNVDGAKSLTVGGAYSVCCRENHVELVDQSFGLAAQQEILLRAETNACVVGTESLHLYSDEKVVLGTASGELCIRAGGSFIKITPTEVTIVGDIVKINSGGRPLSLERLSLGDVPEAAAAAPTAPTPADDAKSGQKSS